MPVVDSTPPALRPFRFHGFPLKPPTNGSDEAIAECPVCRDDKFYVNTETSQWNCVKCRDRADAEGNAADFLNWLQEMSQADTSEDGYEALRSDRGYISTEVLERWGVCASKTTADWLVPGYNADTGRVGNLYKWTSYGAKDGKRHLMPTPCVNGKDGVAHYLHGANLYDHKKPYVFICEGAFDGMALYETMRIAKQHTDGTLSVTGVESDSMLSQCNVIATPGANVFLEQWLPLFASKSVWVMYDNDHPKKLNPELNGHGKVYPPVAWEGMKRVTAMLATHKHPPQSVSFLAWGGVSGDKLNDHDPSLPHGYDVRDFLNGKGSPNQPTRVTADYRVARLQDLLNMVKPCPKEWVTEEAKAKAKGLLTPLPCDSWHTLENAWRKAMYWDGVPGLSKTLAVMCATAMVVNIPGKDQLWIKVISPPSSGKTVLGEAMCVASRYVIAADNIRGFYSGYSAGKDDKTDFSLIEKIKGKMFITLDGDTMLRAANLEDIYAEARRIFDGNSTRHFKNGKGGDYMNYRCAWGLMGTESLREMDNSELGERMLTCRIMSDVDHDLEEQIGLQAVDDAFAEMKVVTNQKAETMDKPERVRASCLTGGYVEYLCRNASTLIRGVETPQWVKKQLQSYGMYISYMRSRPGKKQQEKAQRELSYRLIKQLSRLSCALAAVYGKTEVDEDVMGIIRGVTFDTSEGVSEQIVKLLYEDYTRNDEPGVTEDYLIGKTKQNEKVGKELLIHMRKINMIETFSRQRTPGVPVQPKYRITERMLKVWQSVH